MNFPNTHPLFACLDPDGGRRGNPYLTTADAILAIDYDMHYAAPPTVPASGCKIIHMDMDLKKRGEPLWDRRADIRIEADSSQAIPVLTEFISQGLTPEQRDRFGKRFSQLESEQKTLMKKWPRPPQSPAPSPATSPRSIRIPTTCPIPVRR